MAEYTMTLGGWVSFTLSLGLVIGLFTWCMVRVLCSNSQKNKTSKRLGKGKRN